MRGETATSRFGRGRRLLPLAVLAAVICSAVAAPAASASSEIDTLPWLDTMNRSETPLSNGGKWSALAWDTATSSPTGAVEFTGWHPVQAAPKVHGAYWNPTTFSDVDAGDAAALKMAAAPGVTGGYFAIWLDMSNPGSTRSGYELSWTENSAGSGKYTVKLAKWVGGTETSLASNASVTLAAGATLALTDTGSTVTAWLTTGGEYESLLSAGDSTFSGGYAGIEGSGSTESRAKEFRAGRMLGKSILGVSVLDELQRSELPLATASWSKTSWAEEIGGVWNSGGYLGYGSNTASKLTAAYWNPSSFTESGQGVMVAATVGTGSRWEGEYFSLWLDMPSPNSARSGYEARFAGAEGSESKYTVEIAKWASGTRTVLVSGSPWPATAGTTFAFTDVSGRLVLWRSKEGTMEPFFYAGTDTTYSGGYAGLEVHGVGGSLNNFRAGKFASPPAKPTVSSTSPASPANDNSPKVIGSAEAGSTVSIYTNSSCSGSPAATGSASSFASPGIAASVSDNTTTTFYATAGNEGGASPCSTTSVSYVEDSKAPSAPTFSWTAPASPGKSTAPKIAGSAESGATVKLYTNNTCTSGVAATGTAAAFASAGLATSVSANTSTTYYATATDAAGNVSSCSTKSITYKNEAANIIFEGTKLADFHELQQCETGRIQEVADPLGSGKTVLSFTVKNTDIHSNKSCNSALTPTENPRATALTENIIEPGAEFWLRTRFLIPEGFPTVEKWMSMFSIWGEPFYDTSPWHFEVTTLDGLEGDWFTYQRNSSYDYDIPFSVPSVRGSWYEVLVHEKFAKEGFVEEWLNGNQIEFFYWEVTPWNPNGELPTKKLEMETMDFTNNEHANSLRIGQYREAGSFEPATIYYEFVKVGKTKASVGG